MASFGPLVPDLERPGVTRLAVGLLDHRDDVALLDDITLGTFAAAEQRTYGLELAWPEDQADSSLQGASASFEFSWAAESVP